jgi:hypothetical protein
MDAAKSGTDAVSAPFYDVIFGAQEPTVHPTTTRLLVMTKD